MGLFDKIQDSISSATEQTKSKAQEAQLKRERKQKLEMIGEQLYNLYVSGQLTQEELAGPCQEIVDLDGRISALQQQAQAARPQAAAPEPPPPGQAAPPPSAPAPAAPPPSAPGQAAPPPAAPAQAGGEAVANCPNCGAEVDPGGKFCANCGGDISGGQPPASGGGAPPPPPPPPS